MLFYGDYKDGGYPTAMKLFGRITLQKLTFVWLILTIQVGIFMVSIFKPESTAIFVLLIITGLLGFASSLQLLSKKFELRDARKIFYQINLAFLGTVILVSIGKYLKFQPLS